MLYSIFPDHVVVEVQVEGPAFASALFGPPLRTHLVSLLELERQCCCLW